MTTQLLSMRPVLALLALTSVAHAESHELTLGSSTRALRTSSADALTDQSLVGGRIGYAHLLDIRLVPRLALWATATFGGGAADGTMFQRMSTKIDTLSFAAGGRARYPLLGRWLLATARFELAAARTAVTLREDGHDAGDSGWGPTVEGALGIELAGTRANARFRLGLRMELGYVLAAPVSLTATPSSGSDGTLRLEMSAASLGSLDLSGPSFGITAASGF